MRNIFWTVLIPILLLLSYPVLGKNHTLIEDKTKAFDHFVGEIIAQHSLPGVSVAIIKNRKLEYVKGYGFADVSLKRPMTADTPINIASISKPILGIALLQLVDKGVIDLDTDINTYLPFKIDNPHIENDRITVRHLSTHTSSIDDHYDVSDYQPGADAVEPLVEYLSSLLIRGGKRYEDGQRYLKSVPGDVRKYSNPGAGVAGAVAEYMGKSSLNDLAQKGIFHPLGMTQTSWLISSFEPNTLATRYEMQDDALTALPQYGNPNYPDGGVHSSANDLAKLVISLLNSGQYDGGKLLSEESFSEMFRLQLPENVGKGQRFFWRDREAYTGHTGSDSGVFKLLYFDLKTGNGSIILMNRSLDQATGAAMQKIFRQIEADYF